MNRLRLLCSLAVFGLLMGALSLAASSWPDGLESVAERLGFAAEARHSAAWAPFAGYEAEWLGPSEWAQPLAGACGVVLLYGFGSLLSRWIRRKGTD